MPMRNVARALEMDEPRGLYEVLVDPDTRRLLGAAVLGVEGLAELWPRFNSR